jgi:hypothetical protein
MSRVVLDVRVRTGEEQTLVSVVAPAHEVGRHTVLAVDLENLGIAIGLADVMTLDDEAVTDLSKHGDLPSLGEHRDVEAASVRA